jgi:pimeloyl-ACP methyl ester carboxylesterase
MRFATITRGTFRTAEPRRVAYTERRQAIVWLAIVALMSLATVGGLITTVQAQAPTERKKLPPPELVTLQTKDNVILKATLFPGTEKEESAAVILLHGFKGNRRELEPTAQFLQQTLGCAVIVPDLRGHGASVQIRGSNDRIEAGSLGVADFARMVDMDVEAAKRRLVEAHNARQLNIEKLAVVGCELGAIVGLNWAMLDWSWPPLATGKQGQDVKAVFLISPPWTYRGLKMVEPLSHPEIRSTLSAYLVMGHDDASAVQDARRAYVIFERFHPKEGTPAERGLYFDDTVATKRQGAELLTEDELGVRQRLADFLKLAVVDLPVAWSERRNPLK